MPYPPGGGGDIIARGLAEALTKRFGQPVIIDNKGGATGTIGAYAVVKAPADGYTFLLNQAGPGVTAYFTQKGIPYHPIKDLTPVILMGLAPTAIFVPASSPCSALRQGQPRQA